MSDTTKLSDLLGRREVLLKENENNYRNLGDLEKSICDLQAKVNFFARNIQTVNLQISQIKQQIHEERQGIFTENFISKAREVLSKDAYTKIVSEVNDAINARLETKP